MWLTKATAALLALSLAFAAHAAKLNPPNESWCAALLEVHDSTQAFNASSLYSLRDFGFLVQDILKKVRDKNENLPAEFPLLSEFIFAVDDPNALIPNGKIAQNLQSMEARLYSLEEDVTSLKPSNISFGSSLVGKEAIEAYIDQLKTSLQNITESTESKITADQPYVQKGRLLKVALSASLNAFYTAVIASGVSHFVSSGNSDSLFLSLVTLSFLYPSATSFASKEWVYLKGLFSRDSRIAYENRYNPFRSSASQIMLSYIPPLLKSQETQAFIYNAFEIPTSVEVVNELLAATNDKRPLDSDIMPTSINDRKKGISSADLRRIVVDQIFYFDSATHEPVLLNFIRIKKPKDLTAKRPPKRKSEILSAKEAQEIGVLKPVTIPVPY